MDVGGGDGAECRCADGVAMVGAVDDGGTGAGGTGGGDGNRVWKSPPLLSPGGR